MSTVREEYELTLSARRLLEVLRSAGFSVNPPPGLHSRSILRLVATPAEDKLWLEEQGPDGWKRLQRDLRTQAVDTGSYL